MGCGSSYSAYIPQPSSTQVVKRYETRENIFHKLLVSEEMIHANITILTLTQLLKLSFWYCNMSQGFQSCSLHA